MASLTNMITEYVAFRVEAGPVELKRIQQIPKTFCYEEDAWRAIDALIEKHKTRKISPFEKLDLGDMQTVLKVRVDTPARHRYSLYK